MVLSFILVLSLLWKLPAVNILREPSSRSTRSSAGSATAVKSSSASEKKIEKDSQILLRKYPVTIDGPKPKWELCLVGEGV